MDKGGFGILQLLGDVTRQTEIWILVDRARDQARNVGHGAENLREGIGEGWCRLDRREVNLADVISAHDKNMHDSDVWIYIRIIKPECRFRLAVCYLPGNLHDVVIERASYIVKIAEYEGFFQIKSNSDDVACILSREPHGLFSFKLMFE